MQFRVTKPEFVSPDEARKRFNDGVKAYRQAAYVYAVSKATLYRRINGRRDQGSYEILKQRLTPEEKKSIKNWVLEIQSW